LESMGELPVLVVLCALTAYAIQVSNTYSHGMYWRCPWCL